MSNKKQITLHSLEVREEFDLDADLITSIRQAWESDETRPHLLSLDRPEREYSKHGVFPNSKLLLDSLNAGGENGYNPNRSHYKRLILAMLDPKEQLSKYEAYNLWEVEAREGKYSNSAWPDHSNLSTTGHKSKTLVSDVRQRFGSLYAEYNTSYGTWGGVAHCLEHLAGLMAILIGPLETWNAWADFVPVEIMPDILPLLPFVEGEEEELVKLCEQALVGLKADNISIAHAGMIARVGDAKLAKVVCTERPELIEADTTGLILCKLADHRELYIKVFTDSFASRFDENRFEEIIAIANGPALAKICKGIRRLKKVTDKKRAMALLDKVHTKHLVAGMLDLYDDKKVGKLAERWLLHEGANAIAGLAPEVSGRSKRGKLAASLLQRYRDMGHGQLISDIADTCDESTKNMVHKYVLEHFTAEREEVEEEERPDWLEELMSDRAIARKKLPKFLEIEGLPQVLTRDRKVLSRESVEWLVRTIKESGGNDAHPAIALFQGWLDQDSAANLAQTLADGWIRAGSHKNYAWMFEATRYFHNKFTPEFVEKQTKRWRKTNWEARRDYIDLSIDIIAELYIREGYANALTILLDRSHVGYREGHKAVSRAIDKIVEVGDVTTRSELEDLAVPDFEFNARGERDFDYGTRHFTLRLGDDLSPVFYNPETDDVSERMPSKRKSDDAEKVALARAAYKKDKQLLKKTVERQRERLEHAMEQKLTWKFSHWQEHLLEHPLMKNFAKRLLWRVERLDRSFEIVRVTEDFAFASMEDEDVPFEGFSRVRLAKPSDFGKERAAEWSRVMADYEIVQPFQQLPI